MFNRCIYCGLLVALESTNSALTTNFPSSLSDPAHTDRVTAKSLEEDVIPGKFLNNVWGRPMVSPSPECAQQQIPRGNRPLVMGL